MLSVLSAHGQSWMAQSAKLVGEKGDVSAQLTLWKQSGLSLRWKLPAAERCRPHTFLLMFAEV